MNLKDYIKNINDFLLVEEAPAEAAPAAATPEAGTAGDPQQADSSANQGEASGEDAQRVQALQDLLKRFQELLKKIDGKTTLEEIQAAAGNGQSAPTNNAQQPSAENQQAAPTTQPPADNKQPAPAPAA